MSIRYTKAYMKRAKYMNLRLWLGLGLEMVLESFFHVLKVVEGKPGEISYSVWLRATETAINPA